MKKTYQKPEVLIAYLATQGIIAASDPKGKKVYEEDYADPDKPCLSRQGHHSIWDDEDEGGW